MHRRHGLLGAAALAVGVVACCWWWPGAPAPRPPAAASGGALPWERPATLSGSAAPIPAELGARHPPGSRVAMRVPFVGAGIPCPDGRFLPLLNGVPDAPSLPRSRHLGPVPPVVAKIVDAAGGVWYEHADGSTTTTRWCEVIEDGVRKAKVETVHNARLPDSAGQRLPSQAPVGSGVGSGERR